MAHDRTPFGATIVSASNPTVKLIRSLQRRRVRQLERAFIVEGVRAVEDVLASGIPPRLIVLREGVAWDAEAETGGKVETRVVAPEIFDGLSDVPHPQGVMAIVPTYPELELPCHTGNPLVIVLDAVRDPGNMGTLLRSAAGAGVDHVVIAPECVDPYHPKAVRAAMGALGRVPFSNRTWDEVHAYASEASLVAIADSHGTDNYDQVDWTVSSVAVVGSEAFGPGIEARHLAERVIAIPMANGMESLNAGVAGSLLMFEAARQRRAGKRQKNL